MTTYGLTADGLIVKTIEVIRNELAARVRDTFGTSVKSGSDRAIVGQFVGIISEMAGLLWELSEAVNSSQDPDKATGAALDALCTLTGTFRPTATFSVVTVTLTGTPTSVIPEGTTVKTESTNVTFETTEDATLVLADTWAPLTAYALGDRVTSASRVYQCITAGTSDTPDGPSTTDTDIEDGSAHWTYLGEGTGAVDVIASATETGPVIAYARDLNTIGGSVSGLSSVINLLDVSVGRDAASDEELRQLREAELAGAGNTPIDSVRADLLKLEDVVSVTVFVNNTDETDIDGMPPHSVEALVRPVDPVPDDFDQLIWDTLLANVAAGIVTTGNTPGTATDSQGTVHTMKYSRPTEVPIYIIVNVTKDPDTYPTDGDELIKQAIVTWGDEQATGKNAVASAITAQAFSIDGVLDVTSVKIGTAPTPTLSVTIPIALRELATYDTSRISVVSIDGTP
jgi:uncharacterized phage protein gp47/JayE